MLRALLLSKRPKNLYPIDNQSEIKPDPIMPKFAMTNATVTERALVRRINRKLDKLLWPQRLGVLAERSRGYYNLGRFHVFDVYRNALLYSHVDLVQWARELGVLAEGEQLAA